MAHDHPNVAVALVLAVYLGLCIATTGTMRVSVMGFGALIAGALVIAISVFASLDFK